MNGLAISLGSWYEKSWKISGKKFGKDVLATYIRKDMEYEDPCIVSLAWKGISHATKWTGYNI